MGLGDIFGKAVSIAVPDAIENAVGAGSRKFGEEAMEYGNKSRTSGNTEGHVSTSPGVVAQRGNPVGQYTSQVHNAPLETGEYYEKQLQTRVDAAQGYYRLGKTAVTNPTEIYRGTKQFASAVRENPSLLGDIAVEAAVATATDPMTYAGGGIFAGAAAAERTAGRAVTREVGQAVTRSADDIAESVVSRAAREAAPAGLDDAIRATAANTARANTRSGRFLSGLDEGPANLRETITGNPVGRFRQKRIDIGERMMPGPQSSVPKALIKDTLQGSPTMPTQGAGLGFRQTKWRAQQIGRRASAPGTYRNVERVGLIANDPLKALTSPEAQGYAVQAAQYVAKEHPEIVAGAGALVAGNAALGAYTTAKALTGGGEDEGDAATPARTPYEAPAPTVQEIGLMQFNFDGQTRSTRASRRQPGGATRIGTVQRDSTMPTQVGPKDWYGPQGGYSPGRGFKQPLPPLEQPRQTLGV